MAGSKKKTWIILIIILLLAAGCLTVFLILFFNSQNNKELSEILADIDLAISRGYYEQAQNRLNLAMTLFYHHKIL